MPLIFAKLGIICLVLTIMTKVKIWQIFVAKFHLQPNVPAMAARAGRMSSIKHCALCLHV